MKTLAKANSPLLALLVFAGACGSISNQNGKSQQPSNNSSARIETAPPTINGNEATPVYSYEVVNRWPHDPKSFSQGLVFVDGVFFESAGEYGESSLRRVEPQTGKILTKVDLPEKYFAEGLTHFQHKLFQLTWKEHVCFVYDPESFAMTTIMPYEHEGWGLTHDDSYLIASDGSNRLYFLNPANLATVRTISVYDNGRRLTDLNELEYINGEIYANIWHTDRIARIDPNSGKILGWIDLTGLLPARDKTDEEAVLNGIAYDEAHDRLFVTGKLWPALFEIRLKRK